MAHWMQDHFAALERIAQLTPSERVDAERMWSAAQAAAREEGLKLARLQSNTVTGLEEGGDGAVARVSPRRPQQGDTQGVGS